MTKICTSIEQSKRLLELGFDPESADMVYWINRKDCTIPWEEAAKDKKNIMIYIRPFGGGSLSGYALPCWSVGALLDVIPYNVSFNKAVYRFKMVKFFDHWECYHENFGSVSTKIFKANNPVDACYEMILKLNELNLL